MPWTKQAGEGEGYYAVSRSDQDGVIDIVYGTREEVIQDLIVYNYDPEGQFSDEEIASQRERTEEYFIIDGPFEVRRLRGEQMGFEMDLGD